MVNRTEQMKENVAAFLIDLIDKKGLSQKELAQHIGVSPTMLSTYINKKSLPRIKNLLNISIFAGVPMQRIITGS